MVGVIAMLLLALFAVPGSSASDAAFEAVLGQVQLGLRASQAELAVQRHSLLAGEMDVLARDLADRASRAAEIKKGLEELADHRMGFPRVGLRLDLQKRTWELQGLRAGLAKDNGVLTRIARAIHAPDARLAEGAAALRGVSVHLTLQTGELLQEGLDCAAGLTALGYPSEAQELADLASAADREAREAAFQAQKILGLLQDKG